MLYHPLHHRITSCLSEQKLLDRNSQFFILLMASLNGPIIMLMSSWEIQLGNMNLQGLREIHFAIWPQTYFVTLVNSLQTSPFLLL